MVAFQGSLWKVVLLHFPCRFVRNMCPFVRNLLEDINPSFHHLKLGFAETLPQIDLVVTMAFQDSLLLGQEYHGGVVSNDLDQPHNHKSRN